MLRLASGPHHVQSQARLHIQADLHVVCKSETGPGLVQAMFMSEPGLVLALRRSPGPGPPSGPGFWSVI